MVIPLQSMMKIKRKVACLCAEAEEAAVQGVPEV
jgi:hypothetical protein